MSDRESDDNWAQQVPSRRWHGPYRDYGWERGQSALPEFRDPDIDYMPDERAAIEPWQKYYGRRVVYPGNLPPRGQRAIGPHAGKGPRGYTRSDERIYEEVCDRLTEHGQLDATDIGVDVKNGEVTLTGSTRDRAAKRLAEDICESVSGVRDIHNEIRLQGNTNSTPDRWRDEVGHSGVYPASSMEQAPNDSQTQGEASWGQGERGAEGYNDHGASEIHPGRPKTKKR
jgi:hypothetical protein